MYEKSSSSPTFHVEHLSPGTKYSVQVLAFNSMGQSKPTKVTIRTLKDSSSYKPPPIPYTPSPPRYQPRPTRPQPVERPRTRPQPRPKPTTPKPTPRLRTTTTTTRPPPTTTPYRRAPPRKLPKNVESK